jgi:hypothetical protein
MTKCFLYIGDAKTELQRLASQSVDTCFTSPNPVFYEPNGRKEIGIGSEDTVGEYIDNLVAIIQTTQISVIETAEAKEAKTGRYLVTDCSTLKLDNGTMIETDPLDVDSCFDFTGDGICEVTRISQV